MFLCVSLLVCQCLAVTAIAGYSLSRSQEMIQEERRIHWRATVVARLIGEISARQTLLQIRPHSAPDSPDDGACRTPAVPRLDALLDQYERYLPDPPTAAARKDILIMRRLTDEYRSAADREPGGDPDGTYARALDAFAAYLHITEERLENDADELAKSGVIFGGMTFRILLLFTAAGTALAMVLLYLHVSRTTGKLRASMAALRACAGDLDAAAARGGQDAMAEAMAAGAREMDKTADEIRLLLEGSPAGQEKPAS